MTLWGGETTQEAFLDFNAWGTLPVLELDNGVTIRETPCIYRYIEDIQPQHQSLGDDP